MSGSNDMPPARNFASSPCSPMSAMASAADAAREAAVGTEPPSDLNATPEYRTHLAQVLVRRALEAI